jgi:hypothetical protein
MEEKRELKNIFHCLSQGRKRRRLISGYEFVYGRTMFGKWSLGE